MYQCPVCFSTDFIEIVAEVWVSLIQREDGFETEPSTDRGDHEWSSHSSTACTNCKWVGAFDDLLEV